MSLYIVTQVASGVSFRRVDGFEMQCVYVQEAQDDTECVTALLLLQLWGPRTSQWFRCPWQHNLPGRGVESTLSLAFSTKKGRGGGGGGGGGLMCVCMCVCV